MKRIFYLAVFVALLVCGRSAYAGTCPLASGGSISSAVASCGSGNTVTLAAGGAYAITTQFTLPCGVSIAGPTVPYNKAHNQTAVITGSVGANFAIKTTANCSVPQSISYVEWNGGRNNPGGNFIYAVPGTNGLTVTNNFIHGNNCGAYCSSLFANLVYIAGANPSQTGCCQQSGAITQNVTISWNVFGAVGDCGSGANQYSSSSNTASGGGYCNGVGMAGNLVNIVIVNNTFTDGDNEVKYYEAMTNSQNLTGTSGIGNPVIIRYNDFQRYVRIAYEGQINWGGPNEPTLEYVQYNSFDNMLNPRQQNFDISAANGCVYNYNTTSMTNCETHVDYNISVQDVNAAQSSCGGDPGTEFWSGQNSTVLGNVWIGPYFCHTLDYAPSGNFTANNNIAWVGGSATLCTINKIVSEDSPAFSPSCTGNQSTTGTSGTITSVAPVLTVAGGVITITNTNVSSPNGSNPGRDSNTTFWCTGDGSVPTPGGSNSTPYWVGAASQTVGSFTPSSGTGRCVGMWGAPNQPYSYDSGYGYVASAVVTATTSGPTTATPVFSPTATSFSSSITVTVTDATSGATIYCTQNGSTPTTSSTVYSTPLLFTATTQLQCMAAASGNNNSAIASATYTLTASGTTATPTFSPTSQSFTGTLNVTITDSTAGSTIYYTTNGSTPTISSSVYSTALALTATTTVNAIATAPGLSQSGMGTGTYTLGSAPTLTGGYQANGSGTACTGGINTMVVGSTPVQQYACGSYSDSNVRTLPDAYGNIPVWTSTDPTKVTVSNTGVVACIATTGSTTVYTKVESSPTSPNPNVLLNSWGWTCTPSTLQGITIACTTTYLSRGQQAPCIATCIYPVNTTNCTRLDPDGNQASFISSATAIGTITANGGVYWSASAGTSIISATAGSFTSNTVPITNIAAGLYGLPVGHNTPWIGFGK